MRKLCIKIAIACAAAAVFMASSSFAAVSDSITYYVTVSLPPTVPVLSSPSDNWTTNYATINFDWNDSTDDGSGVSNYDLQVSTEINFNSVNYSSSPVTSQASLTTTEDVYYWRVRAKDNAGNYSAWTDTRTFTVDTAEPDSAITVPVTQTAYKALTLLQGTADDGTCSGVNKVGISIRDLTRGATYWNGSSWQESVVWSMASYAGGSWSYSFADSNWTSGHEYQIQSRAVDNAGNSETSVAVSSFTFDNTAPVSAVEYPVLCAHYVDVDSITGTAYDADSNLSQIDVRLERTSDYKYWDAAASSWSVSVVWSSATGTTNWNLDTTPIVWSTGHYLVQSRALDVAGNFESVTSSSTFEIVFSTPDAPGSFSGTAESTASINWSWADVANEDGYRLKNSTGGVVAELSSAATNYVETGLSVNTSYQRYVEAYNVSGSSASLTDSVYTLAAVPDKPSFDGVYYTSATVSWTDFGGTEYYVECSTASNFSVSEQSSGWITAAIWDASSLADDTTYYFRVKARNGDSYETDFSASASTVTLYTDVVPPTVGITVPADGSYNNNSLTQIQGTCEDDVAVSTAAIRIYNQTNAKYWNDGTSLWDIDLALAESAWFAPELSSGGTFWWYNSPTLADTKVYEINAKAKDSVENWSVTFATAVFTYDITKPVSVVGSPANGVNLATLTSLAGTAADAISGVSQVKIQITDLTLGATYWNGGGWVESSAWLNTTWGNPDWSYNFSDADWTEGHTYKIQPMATDVAGNIESALSASTFTFSKAGVKLQVLLPGETAVPGAETGKTGKPSARTAGVAFNVTVNAVDDLWNIVVNSLATVALTTSDVNDTEPASADVVSGVKIFTVTMVTAGTATITAADIDGTPLTSDISSIVTVNPDTAVKLQVLVPGEAADPGSAGGKTGTPATQVAGANFTVTINACDNYWNIISTNPTVTVTTDDPMDTDPGNINLTAGTVNVNVTLVSPSTGTLITATAAGYTGGVSAYVAVSSTDTVPPTVGITAPSAPYLKSLTLIEGTCADNVAVSSVTVRIEREDALVWSGADWSAADVWLDADNLYVSSWSHTTAVTLDDGVSYGIFAKAKDSNDNWSTVYDTITFTYDISLPTSTITYPVTSGQYADLTSINGTAIDAVTAVNTVWIELKRVSDNFFWAGSSWTATQTALLTSGTTSWGYDSSSVIWAAGYYSIYSAAGDMADNIEITGAPVTFEIILSTPAAPTGFAGAAQSAESIQWNWEDVAEEEGYRLKTSTGGIVTELATDTTYYIETGLAVNSSYYRYVEAYNAGGSSSSSLSARYTHAYPPLSTYLVSSSTGSATITWQDNSNPVGTVWGIERATDNFVSALALKAFADNYTTIGYTDSGLAPATTYYYRVRAYNHEAVPTAFDSVVATRTVAVELAVSTPAAPSLFSGTAQSASSIMWSWTDSSGNEDGFELKDSSGAVIQTFAANTTFYLETGLGVNEETYRYIAAYNSAGEGASIPAAIHTLAKIPSAFSVTSASSSITLQWSANGNPAGTDYDIEWSTAADFSVTDYDTTTDLSYKVAPLLSAVTYYIRVRALNGDLHSSAFYETSAFTGAPDTTAPSAVTAFTAEAANMKGAVKLSWTNPGDDGTVGIIYGGAQMIRYVTGATAAGPPDIVIVKDITPGTTETLTITGLVPGGAYTFYIRVKDASENISEEVSAAASAGAQPVLAVSGITSPITAGVSSNFTVRAKNALGETDTSYAGTITFGSSVTVGSDKIIGSNAMSALPADYSFTSSDSGARVFEAVFLEKGELYSCYVRATDTGDSLITGQQVVTVSPLDFISGIVTQKDGTPITGVYVEAYGAGLSTGVFPGTVNGSYTITDLGVGTYTVRATWTGAGGLESSAEKQTPNGTAAFNFTLGVNFDLGVVQGMVSGLSASKIRSASGLIMPQSVSEYAFVEISAGRKVMRIPVASDGSFRVSNLLPGRYSARAWDGSRYSNSETLVLSGGASVTLSFTFPVSAEVYCWPNPFAALKTSEAGVHIAYIGAAGYDADLKIYTLTGELVRKSRDFSAFIRAEDSQEGREFIWDLRNNDRQDVASGVYFYTLELRDSAGGGKKQYRGKIGVVR